MLPKWTRVVGDVSTGASTQEAVAGALAVRDARLNGQSTSYLIASFRFGKNTHFYLTFRKASAIMWAGAEGSREAGHALIGNCPS
jgi:hypothetical protein